MGKNNSGDKSEYWKKMIAEQIDSGFTVEEYCELSGETLPRFYYWKRRLVANSGDSVKTKNTGTSEFIELTGIIRDSRECDNSIAVNLGAFTILMNEKTSDTLFIRTARLLLGLQENGRHSA